MPKDPTWFERKVRELADALRRLPPDRQEAAVESLEADREPGARQGTDRLRDTAEDHVETLALGAREPE